MKFLSEDEGICFWTVSSIIHVVVVFNATSMEEKQATCETSQVLLAGVPGGF